MRVGVAGSSRVARGWIGGFGQGPLCCPRVRTGLPGPPSCVLPCAGLIRRMMRKACDAGRAVLFITHTPTDARLSSATCRMPVCVTVDCTYLCGRKGMYGSTGHGSMGRCASTVPNWLDLMPFLLAARCRISPPMRNKRNEAGQQTCHREVVLNHYAGADEICWVPCEPHCKVGNARLRAMD